MTHMHFHLHTYSHAHQFSSVAQSCVILCEPMNRSTPGLPVHHQLPEFTQTHVHRVGDAIQPSHPLSSLLLLPPMPPSIRVFSNESTLVIHKQLSILYWILFPYRLLQNTEQSSLCYTVRPCRLFYIQYWVYVNPNLLIYPSPSSFPFGNHKFVFQI